MNDDDAIDADGLIPLANIGCPVMDTAQGPAEHVEQQFYDIFCKA